MACRSVTWARRILRNPWVRSAMVATVAVVSLWNIDRVPAAAPLPLLPGVLAWAIGKYVLSPLRWRAISRSGRTPWWHLRVYAEAELLGLLTPMHAGADVWRLHRLHEAGMRRPPAAAELALDRLIGAVGISLAVLLTGVTLPPLVMGGVAAIGAGALALGVLVRVRRPDLFTHRPLPGPWVLVASLLLSLGFQATILGRLVAVTAALGYPLDPVRLAAVFGVSQVAGILPGVNGASPRDGALAVGLVSLGLPVAAALAAVALLSTLAWPPAVLLGGASFTVRRLAARRTSARARRAHRDERYTTSGGLPRRTTRRGSRHYRHCDTCRPRPGIDRHPGGHGRFAAGPTPPSARCTCRRRMRTRAGRFRTA